MTYKGNRELPPKVKQCFWLFLPCPPNLKVIGLPSFRLLGAVEISLSKNECAGV